LQARFICERWRQAHLKELKNKCMEFTFTLGDKEKTEVQLRRNQFTGMFTYRVNGELKTLRSPADASTHFPTENIAYYRFAVGETETFDIRVIHTWPERFPAFKRQKYDILVNGDLVKTVISY
jgi:hypothetical protein